MSVIADALREFYGNLEGREYATTRLYLAGNAEFVGVSFDRTARGQTEVLKLLQSWAASFAEMRFMGIRIRNYSDRVGQIPGARYCYEVTYHLVGRYVRALPGLERRAPASNATVYLRVTDMVWLNAEGGIVRINRVFPIVQLG